MNSGSTRSAAKGVVIACALLMSALVAGRQSTETSNAPAPPNAPGRSAAMPSVDQILDRYVEAVGGRAAIQKLTSRVMTGTLSVPSMQLSGTVEIHEKAPNRSLGTITINGATYRQGFDGTAGWTDDPANGLRDQTGAELAESRRESDFYHNLNLHKLYTKFALVGKEKISEHDAYAVEASVPEGGPPEKLYFDAQSGLVLRDSSQRHGPDGASEFQQDYDDYREIDGIKLPFTIRQINEGTMVVIIVQEYHHNVPMDDAEFAKPGTQ